MWETCPLVHTNCTIAPGERFRLRDSVLRCAVGCESCGYMQLAAADAFRSFLCTRHRRPPPSTKMRTQSNPDGRAASKSTNQPVSVNSFLRAFCFALCSVTLNKTTKKHCPSSTLFSLAVLLPFDYCFFANQLSGDMCLHQIPSLSRFSV